MGRCRPARLLQCVWQRAARDLGGGPAAPLWGGAAACERSSPWAKLLRATHASMTSMRLQPAASPVVQPPPPESAGPCLELRTKCRAGTSCALHIKAAQGPVRWVTSPMAFRRSAGCSAYASQSNGCNANALKWSRGFEQRGVQVRCCAGPCG